MILLLSLIAATLSRCLESFELPFERLKSATSRAWIIDLHPSSSLDRRRLVTPNSTGSPPFLKSHHNAIYAGIPDIEHPDHKTNRRLHLFYKYRHLSRYEKAFRKENGFDLHLDWNGQYDEEFSDRSFFNTTRRSLSTVLGGQLNNYQAVPLSQGYGTHFANIWVGSPTPQRKTVIVDTGSHYTAFPCSGCRNCGASHHTDAYFDPTKSNTFRELQCDECQDGVMCKKGKCRFRQAYTEGSSWAAVQVMDQFYCGGADVLDSVEPGDQKYQVEFMFGCQEKTSGQFITQLADGIMGMSAHPATLTRRLYDAKKLEFNMFAMCFRRELGTSKHGVSAGSMTLGGFSNTLDTSPMVYAKNMAKIGWFTVYVKNIYIRTTGGQSAKSVDANHRTVRVNMDIKMLNSGKGVIVDSGTTDTYLNKKIAKQFAKAWKSAMGGQTYSHTPMALTADQLRRLPTILIQCQAHSLDPDPSIDDYDSIPGYTGSLDRSGNNSRDLLIAIPASSYMDYNAVTNEYMSRLYFTESMGGVLGSNTMQGHNVLFDWHNGRVGFAESSCTYDKKEVPAAAEDPGFPSDCEVGDPILTKPCIDSVDRRACDVNYDGIKVLGNETWTALVDSPGNDAGVSCRSAAKIASGDDLDSERIVCNLEGVCEETRGCEMTCAEADEAAASVPTLVLPDKGGRKKPECGEFGWSACDYSCSQTRIISKPYSDGNCHEEGRETRVCHKGACAHSDPCRVPFLVHVVLLFRGGSSVKWARGSDEVLATAVESAFERHLDEKLFTAGDVHVAMALPWYQDLDEEENSTKRGYKRSTGTTTEESTYQTTKLGLRVVLEISMFNPLVESGLNTTIEDHRHAFIGSALANITERIRGRKTECTNEGLYSLAKSASRTKQLFRQEAFFKTLIDVLTQMDPAEVVPFGPLTQSAHNMTSSGRVLSAWTIRTRVEDEVNFNGPQRPLIAKLLSLLQILLILTAAPFVLVSLGNGLQALREFVVGHRRQGRRYFVRQNRPEVNNTNANDVESSIIMGTARIQETYKVTRPAKRRFRSFQLSGR